LKKQVKGTPDNEFLQKHCLSGIEPRPEPYLFSLMNLMLHGIGEPNIARVNTLETKLSDIQEDLQHEIIMTNPPFGGEEAESIKRKFPAKFQTKDTALGFILHCVTRLNQGGKCAIILPRGEPLSSDGIPSRVRQKLLEECNLHTIIKLPKTVFAPYTNIETNILFFEKTKPTKEIWYYKKNMRPGIKAFSKTKPILYEDFDDVIKWWNNRQENDYSWKVNIDDLENYDLDRKNPNEADSKIELSPSELIESMIKDENDILETLEGLKKNIKEELS